MRHVGGATAYTFASGFGGAQKQLQLQLQGPDQTVLNAATPSGSRRSWRRRPGAVDVGLSTKGQKPEFNVRVNRGLAGTLGVSVSQLAASLRFAFAGVDAGTWVDPAGISRYVHVRLVPTARENAADLGQLPVLVTPSQAGAARHRCRAGRSSFRSARSRTITPSTGRRRSTTISANAW